MISDPQLIELLTPAAPSVLSTDATAIAQLAKRKSTFAALDSQPAAMAMANERRAMVATQMRATIAPELGWTLIEDNLAYGAYEWLAGDVIVRLSKTTRASRFEALKASYGIQDALFETTADPHGPHDEVLIRLMGNVLTEASVDATAIRPDGSFSNPIPLRSLAEIQTQRLPDTGAPAKTTVTLPDRRRSAESPGG